MNNNGWITDRPPKLEEATNEGDVWVYDIGADEYYIRNYEEVIEGQPWMEIPPPEPYVKPKRFQVSFGTFERHCVIDRHYRDFVAKRLPTREAANRILAIYEEVIP